MLASAFLDILFVVIRYLKLIHVSGSFDLSVVNILWGRQIWVCGIAQDALKKYVRINQKWIVVVFFNSFTIVFSRDR